MLYLSQDLCSGRDPEGNKTVQRPETRHARQLQFPGCTVTRRLLPSQLSLCHNSCGSWNTGRGNCSSKSSITHACRACHEDAPIGPVSYGRQVWPRAGARGRLWPKKQTLGSSGQNLIHCVTQAFAYRSVAVDESSIVIFPVHLINQAGHVVRSSIISRSVHPGT